MCGIAGFYSPSQKLSINGVALACRAMRHRGPDDEGYVALSDNGLEQFRGSDTVGELQGLRELECLSDTNLLLAHRRLSIIDLSVGGHQPIVDECNQYSMVFNGEIYNYVELRNELQQLGHVIRSNSDSEVALKAWMQWGNRAFNRFNGMWAMAIWDQRLRVLTLSRDRFGVKPLYLARRQGAIYFASEMKVLRGWEGLNFKPDHESVDRYLRTSQISSTEHTFWHGIEEVPPGSWLEMRADGSVTREAYWVLVCNERSYADGEAEYEFAHLFQDALRLRMRSDVEVGALLSGGLDSSVIVGGLFSNKLVGGNGLKSFSAVFREPEYSEEGLIDLTATRYPLEVHKILPDPVELQQEFGLLLETIEEPFRSLSVYSQFKIYQHIRAKTQVKVVLNGQGADELFGGYSAHYYYLLMELLADGRLGSFVDELRRLRRGRQVPVSTLLKGLLAAVRSTKLGHRGLSSMLADEVNVTPLREYLRYDDRTSMAFGVEARAPFMDFRLVEFAFTLPSNYKIHKFRNKVIERNYAESVVVPEVVNRPDKMGFVSPQEQWQQSVLTPWFDEVFRQMASHTAYFSGKRALDRYQNYQKGSRSNWETIWRYFCLYQWLRSYGYE